MRITEAEITDDSFNKFVGKDKNSKLVSIGKKSNLWRRNHAHLYRLRGKIHTEKSMIQERERENQRS